MDSRISRWYRGRCTRCRTTLACRCQTRTWLVKWEAISRCVRTRWTLPKSRSNHPKIIPLDQKRISPSNSRSPRRRGTVPRSRRQLRDPKRSSTVGCSSSSIISMAPSWSSTPMTRMSLRSTPSWKRMIRTLPSTPRRIKLRMMKIRTRMSPPIGQAMRMRRRRVRTLTRSILAQPGAKRMMSRCRMIGAKKFTLKRKALRMVT